LTNKLAYCLLALACLTFVAAGCADDDTDTDSHGQHTDAGTADVTPDVTSEPDVDPVTCDDGLSNCRGECVDLNESRENCGRCRATCFEWTGTCTEGTCVCNDEDETYCGDDCFNLTDDRQHCGQCGLECAGGEANEREVCHDSVCKTRIERVTELTVLARSTETNCDTEGVFPPTGGLRIDPELNVAAQAHADDMAENVFMNHTGSDGSGPGGRVGRTAYPTTAVGENIARGYSTSEDVVQGWIDSDGHCSNIMNDRWKAIGVGIAVSEGGEMFWAQVFGPE
jgi:hypothetical protein